MSKENEEENEPTVMSAAIAEAIRETEKPEEPEVETTKEKVVEPEAGLIEIDKSGALVLGNHRDAMRIAAQFVEHKMVPKTYETPQQVLAGWQTGSELGFSPMQALTCLAMINGNPSLHTDGPLSLVMASGDLADIEEYFFDANGEKLTTIQARIHPEMIFGAYTKLTRKRIKTPVDWAYTLKEAEQAGLYHPPGLLREAAKDKRGNKLKWQKLPWYIYTVVMLQRRARAFPLKTLFADVLKGTKIAEYDFNVAPDLQDVKDVDGSDRTVKTPSARSSETESEAADIISDLKGQGESKVVFKGA